MNARTLWGIGWFVVSMVFWGAGGFAVEPAEVAADHESMAAGYEKKAAAQEELVAEHTRMKQDYRARFFINEKVTPDTKIREMEKHCDSIIAEAAQLETEFLDFAKWHRMRAAELKGQ